MTIWTLVISLILTAAMPIEGHSKGLLAGVLIALHAVALAYHVFLGGWQWLGL